MRRAQLANIAINGFRRGNILIREVVRQRLNIHVPGNAARRPKSLYFGAENDPPAIPGIEKRLFANSVARKQEFPLAAVPKRDRKHPAQLRKTFLAELLVQMNNGLRIRTCAECVAVL